jgi:hypothetical protein
MNKLEMDFTGRPLVAAPSSSSHPNLMEMRWGVGSSSPGSLCRGAKVNPAESPKVPPPHFQTKRPQSYVAKI